MELQTPCRSVRVLADASSLEIFVNGGEAVFTTRYYPEPGPVTLRLEGAAGTVWAPCSVKTGPVFARKGKGGAFWVRL